MPDVSAKLRRMQWVAVGLCTFAIALNYIDRSTLALGNLKIREEFGINAAGIGALQSAWSLSFALTQLPVGLMVDRIGSRRLLGWALVLWSARKQRAACSAATCNSSDPASPWACSRRLPSPPPSAPSPISSTRKIAAARPGSTPSAAIPGGWSARRCSRLLLISVRLAGHVRHHGRHRTCWAPIGWFTLYRDPDLTRMDTRDRAYLVENKVGERSPVTVQRWRSALLATGRCGA